MQCAQKLYGQCAGEVERGGAWTLYISRNRTEEPAANKEHKRGCAVDHPLPSEMSARPVDVVSVVPCASLSADRKHAAIGQSIGALDSSAGTIADNSNQRLPHRLRHQRIQFPLRDWFRHKIGLVGRAIGKVEPVEIDGRLPYTIVTNQSVI